MDNEELHESEVLVELAERQLRAYAGTLERLAEVDPEAVDGRIIGSYMIGHYSDGTHVLNLLGPQEVGPVPVLEAVRYAIKATFGEARK